jgi:hypothetical protein
MTEDQKKKMLAD